MTLEARGNSPEETLTMPRGYANLHRAASAQLGTWRAPSKRLADVQTEMLAALQADRTAMWREHSRVHFTASLLLFNEPRTHIALTLHKKAKRWFQFGGHFESQDESLVAAAEREGREESGVTSLTVFPDLVAVDAHDLASAFGHCSRHLDLRFCGISNDPLAISHESDDVRWWALTDLPDDAEASLVESIELALDYLNQRLPAGDRNHGLNVTTPSE